MILVFGGRGEQLVGNVVGELRLSGDDRVAGQVALLVARIGAKAVGDLLLVRIAMHHVQPPDASRVLHHVHGGEQRELGHDEPQ